MLNCKGSSMDEEEEKAKKGVLGWQSKLPEKSYNAYPVWD